VKPSALDAVFKYGIQPRELPLWADCVIAVMLFVGFGFWGTRYWQRTAAPNQPFYYQLYFEPAVMVACGKGYVVAMPQVPEMVAFLQRRTDQFSCAAIPSDAHLGTEELFQLGSWQYLLTTVGYTWRLFGLSWSALGPLFGVLFGATMASLYGIFRLAMGPLFAVACTVGLKYSILQLKYLPHLRDYSKAPFSLLLIVVLGMLVLSQLNWKRTLLLAAAYGAVLGIGYGFRTDVLIDIPPVLVTLALFVPGGVFRNLGIKASAAAVFLLVFLATAWPVISTTGKAKPGCLWHVVALGFARQFDPVLGVDPAPYEVSREYLDEWVYTTMTSSAARARPGVGHIEYCEVEYGDATRAYLTDIVRRFPADVIVRGYASVLRIVELPFSPVPGIDDEAESPPEWRSGNGIGLALVTAAIMVVTAVDLRLGLFLLFFVLYFGATPAIQFDHRHFFHLEFITWWAGAFLVQVAITKLPPLVRERQWKPFSQNLLRAAAVLAACVLVLGATLWAARAYQQPRVRSMMTDYLAAPREAVPLGTGASLDSGVRAAPQTDPETADFVAVDINGPACGEHSTVTFRYDAKRRPYGRSFAVPRDADGAGLSHIFMPIYDQFDRIEFADAPPGCIVGVYRVRDANRFPMLLEVLLRPGWRREPLYQRLVTF